MLYSHCAYGALGLFGSGMLVCHINIITHFVHTGALAESLTYAYMLRATRENVSETDPALGTYFPWGGVTQQINITVTLCVVEQSRNLVV